MALATTLPALLETLTQSLNYAFETAEEKATSLHPPKDGISLLDIKNELFLSYLQNLVFLILLKIRNGRSNSNSEGDEDLENSVTNKLLELSIYIDKGVLHLEKGLKYQIDKVVRAADDARIAVGSAAKTKSTVLHEKHSSEEEDVDEESDSEDEDEGGVTLKASEIDDLQYRPNPSSLIRPSFAGAESNGMRSEDGLYKPPRIQATAMPTTERRDKDVRKPNKSATLDEFISTELSTAPLAEPSIGSGIIDGGRRSKSEKEIREEKERRDYEERNYVRLPKQSKKERAKKGRRDAGYGGEEWRGLGEGVDRIDRLTKRKSGEVRSVLEKSRKRPTEDGPRGTGAELGQGFQKRLKTLDGGRRDRGRR